MTVYHFYGPSARRHYVGKCSVCGKYVKRSRTFEQTISPFNRNPETGLPRTWDEVVVRVNAEADAWKPDFTHEKCSQVGG